MSPRISPATPINVTDFGAERWNGVPDLAGYAWRSIQARAIVLLQHGYGEYAGRYVDHYSRLVPSLVARGFDVYAFDLAGHGLSSGDRGITDVQAMVQAHQAARRLLRQQGKLLFVIGHSLGGLVTAASVAGEQDGVAGVVLSGPALPARSRFMHATARVIAAFAPGCGIDWLRAAEGISRIDEEVRAYTNDPLIFRRAIPAKLGVTAVAAAESIWPRLTGWRVPTLAIHGTSDTYTDPKGSERLVAGIASPDKALCLVEGGRHELLNDLPREEMLRLILGWLEARW